MNKGLEALEDIKQLISTIELAGKKDKAFVNDELGLIEKELKALEIIKEKGLNVNDIAWLKRNDYKGYKWNLEQLYKDYDDEHLEQILKTQEEYDLLREVLL